MSNSQSLAVKAHEAVKAWRKQQRAESIERRMAIEGRERTRLGELAKQQLENAFDLRRHRMLGIYWPFRGEIDVRDLAERHIANGGEAALPVVVTKAAPLEFWRWRPGMKLDRGIWNIPIPAERDVVQPDALIIPLVGFDKQGYRLGYGGGYYDRTIASMQPQPFRIGLGYAEFELPTIQPQPHDIAMNAIVTEHYVRRIV